MVVNEQADGIVHRGNADAVVMLLEIFVNHFRTGVCVVGNQIV